MRILMTAGGTAGHINPALAIAKKIKQECPAAEIHFAGRKNGMEYHLVQKEGYPFHEIEVRGIQRKISLQNVARNTAALYYLATSIPRANAILQKVQPDLVMGTGGYVSAPIVKQAAKRGILTAIHEQNALPGVTNKILAKDADAVFVAMSDAVSRLGADESRIQVTGNPVRDDVRMIQRKQARKALNISEKDIVIVSFGGSLGAEKLNSAVAELAKWEQGQKNLFHLHATGKIEKDNFAVLAKDMGIDQNPAFQICEYIEDMPSALIAADLIISRAGALTLAEIAAAGRAAILIPSPNVAENHQYYNALAFEKAGAACILQEKDMAQTSLATLIEPLLSDPVRLMEMGSRARSLDTPHALEQIVQGLMELLKTGKLKKE